MYDNFKLKMFGENEPVVGYEWKSEHPEMVLVLIHGLGEHCGRYDRLAKRLLKENIAVVGMDLRGHGITGGSRGHCAPRNEVLEDIDDLIAYAKEAYPDLPLAIYGHSMGGNLVLDYRNRGGKNDDPVCYVVSAPWLILYKKWPKPIVKMVDLLAKIKPTMKLASSIEEKDLGNLKYVSGYKKDPLVNHVISAETASKSFALGKAIAEGTAPSNHKAKDIPMLLMHGTADVICSIAGSRRYAEHSGVETRFKVWEGYCHEIHNGGEKDDGSEVLETIVEFLNSFKK